MSNRVVGMPKTFARQLLAFEAVSGQSDDAKTSAAFRVCEELRGPLSKLLGAGGFWSLQSRALALAGAEVPWLRRLKLKADGSFDHPDRTKEKLDAGVVAEGELILVGHLLGLLVTFIGPALTLQLLHDVWPKWNIEVLEGTKTYAEK